MHAKLNTVVRYYDKMLEDRLATTYLQATYQEARPPMQSPQLYQYNPPPQSPISSSRGYPPGSRSTFSDNLNVLPPAQVPQDSQVSFSPNHNITTTVQPPATFGHYNAYPPPSMSPVANKGSTSQSYMEPTSFQYETYHSQEEHQTSQPSNMPPPQSTYQGQPPYAPYVGTNGYYAQHPLQRREESSLIDL